jgi:hypothetical protein
MSQDVSASSDPSSVGAIATLRDDGMFKPRAS